jgi:hypothetical protein
MIDVHAAWDAAANRWIADSEDTPGLSVEAETLEELQEKVARQLPALLGSNVICPFRLIPLARYRATKRTIN